MLGNRIQRNIGFEIFIDIPDDIDRKRIGFFRKRLQLCLLQKSTSHRISAAFKYVFLYLRDFVYRDLSPFSYVMLHSVKIEARHHGVGTEYGIFCPFAVLILQNRLKVKKICRA